MARGINCLRKIPDLFDNISGVNPGSSRMHMVANFALVVFLQFNSVLPGQHAVNADQFYKIVQSSTTQTQSISFAFEGELLLAGKTIGAGEKQVNEYSSWFQYTFAERSDNSIAVEGFWGPKTFGSLAIFEKSTLLKTRLESTTIMPDRAYRKPSLQVAKGNVSSFRLDKLPFFFLAHFLREMTVDDLGYEFVQWEAIDEHQCLVAKIDLVPRSLNPDAYRYKVWFDVQRGGNPLKVETFKPNGTNDLVEVLDDVQLEKFSSPSGSKVWLPVGGKCSSFGWNDVFYSSPVYVKTASIIRDTVKIDETIPDQVFTVAGPSRLTITPSLRKLERVFKDQSDAANKKYNAETVQGALNRRLEEADKQSDELEASSPIRSWQMGRIFLQSVFGLGALTLLYCFYRRRTS